MVGVCVDHLVLAPDVNFFLNSRYPCLRSLFFLFRKSILFQMLPDILFQMLPDINNLVQ